jgi:hypothetical protein
MSPSDRVSIYLPEHLRGVVDLVSGDPGLSARIASILDRYRHLVRVSRPALTRAEWCLVLDGCSGWATPQEPAELLLSGLALEVQDHIRLNDAGEKWGLTTAQCDALLGRLIALRPVETLAVMELVERFWRRSGLETDEAMREAGIVPTDPGFRVRED